jgi:SRSO17 transposase
LTPTLTAPVKPSLAEVYLRGLIQEGERKSIEPLSRRVSLPPELAAVADPEQALQQFVSQSHWDEAAVAREYRATMAEGLADPDGVFLLDDTTFPKAGQHSVGVRAPALRGLGQESQWSVRRVAALRQLQGPLPAFHAALPAAGLAQWPRPTGSGRGAPRSRPRLATGAPEPVTLAELAARTPLRRVTWRQGTKGPLSARFAWLRLWPAYGWEAGECAGAPPHWLLIEQRPDGSIRDAFSNLPANTSRLRAVRYWRSRWPVEQGYQQMKEELGLDHFEGRCWHGFHRHAVLVMMAYGFLTLERLRLQEKEQQQQQQQQQQQEAGRPLGPRAPGTENKAPPP